MMGWVIPPFSPTDMVPPLLRHLLLLDGAHRQRTALGGEVPALQVVDGVLLPQVVGVGGEVVPIQLLGVGTYNVYLNISLYFCTNYTSIK